MQLSWFDIFLLVCAFGFVWGGYWSGLIQSIGGIVGLFVGQFIASRYYIQFADAVQPVFAGNAILAKVFAFVLIFLFVTRLVGVIFWLVNKIFHMIAIVPGMKFVNRIGGAVFGLIEASLFIGITLQFLTRLPISAAFASTLKASAVAGYFLGVTGWLVPLFPSVIRQAQDATKLIPNIDINATMKTINAVQNSGLVK
jgi:membrane protein required for colicin V production